MNNNLYFICRSGKRSYDAAKFLISQGFTSCITVSDGFEGKLNQHHKRASIDGWKSHNLPWKQEWKTKIKDPYKQPVFLSIWDDLLRIQGSYLPPAFQCRPPLGWYRCILTEKPNFTKNRFFGLGASNSFLIRVKPRSKEAPRWYLLRVLASCL